MSLQVKSTLFLFHVSWGKQFFYVFSVAEGILSSGGRDQESEGANYDEGQAYTPVGRGGSGDARTARHGGEYLLSRITSNILSCHSEHFMDSLPHGL